MNMNFESRRMSPMPVKVIREELVPEPALMFYGCLVQMERSDLSIGDWQANGKKTNITDRPAVFYAKPQLRE